MYILGINAVFHDSAACILKDGQLIAAAEDERFTHIKHGKRPIPFSTYELPYHAIYFCLEKAGIHLREVDHIAYSFDPALLNDEEGVDEDDWEMPSVYNENRRDGQIKLEPKATLKKRDIDHLFLSSIEKAPRQLVDGWPHHLQDRFLGSRISDWEWHFVEHHLAHAASAFYPSPFERAAIITLDGRGELCTATFNTGQGTEILRHSEVHFPDSLGLLYEKVTTHLGFLHSSDEYKVLALASYGEPRFLDAFREMIYLETPGRFKTNWNLLEEKLGPARKRNEPFTLHHFNIAHSLQKALEEVVLELVQWFRKTSGAQQLCLAGGIALNCVLNGRIQAESGFESVWVQPAAGDSGTALGAALAIDLDCRAGSVREFQMTHAYWGPAYSDDTIEQFLRKSKIPFRKLEDVERETAELLAEDKIVGWFQGPMEFGPRALGGRSILASPIHASMQQRLNEVKDREDFRPVAPVVTEEAAGEWFENAGVSPFMLFVYPIRSEKEEFIPAVKHVDGTARIQTVNRDQNPLYYDLLKEFEQLTDVPILVNTSFNTLGKPIVNTPADAVACFWTSPFDALVLGAYLIEK